jgi:hypothetical protein
VAAPIKSGKWSRDAAAAANNEQKVEPGRATKVKCHIWCGALAPAGAGAH